MLIERPNPNQLVLQVTANNQDGTPKTELRSARVKVYHVVSGAPVDLLDWTDMTQIGTSNVWKYDWEPSSLAVGQYTIQYALQDMAYAHFSGLEDLVVQDFALQTELETDISNLQTAIEGDITDLGDTLGAQLVALQADVTLLKKVARGRWKIDDVLNQMIFYDDDGTTPLLTFDLKDINGLPSSVNVFERVLVP